MKIIVFILALCILSISLLQAQDTINVSSGWNMIGAISTKSLNQIRSVPPGIITSSYYGYSPGGYSLKDTIKKGSGYWVKANQTGIIIAESANQPPGIPSTPIPGDNTSDVSISPILLWSCSDPDNNPLMYDVYLGTDNPPVTKVSSAQSNSYLIRSGLNYNTVYHWKVVAKDSHNDSTAGSVWQFTTAAAINQPPVISSIPIPADNDTGVYASQALEWNCSDPDNDPLTYDVYFGTDNPPATKVSSAQTDNNLSRSGLNDATTYYWQVVAKDNHGGSASSPVWSYTTASPWFCTYQVVYSRKTYNTVEIGTQCWMKENLDIGTMISGVATQTDNSIVEKYCYNNDPANCTTLGAFYQWNEAMKYSTTEGTQGICPSGWHIPTNVEMQTLKTTVSDDGNALKAIGQGTGGGTGTNTSGFSALLVGSRDISGIFYGLGEYTLFWSSTPKTPTSTYAYLLSYNNSSISSANYDKINGFNIRCLRN